jgi:predicted pyridoxine 5'-phosphate oxidase superfamily flavin-nucleotide-binding protein
MMAYTFGSLVFTPVVKALQERFGSRPQYARREESYVTPKLIGPDEREFLAERDSFYLATVGATGWPYVQHRGGPKGFLKVIDERTVAFADFRGNKQFVSTGNLLTDDRVALILVDYPHRTRLKILGHIKIIEGEEAKEWVERLKDPNYPAVVERIFVINVEASDWNCQQHITPRFTADEIRQALTPFEKRFLKLEQENEQLRGEIERRKAETQPVK